MKFLDEFFSPRVLKWMLAVFVLALLFANFEFFNVIAFLIGCGGAMVIIAKYIIPIMEQNSWTSAQMYQDATMKDEEHFLAGKIALVTVVLSLLTGVWVAFFIALPICMYNKWFIKKLYKTLIESPKI